MEREAGALGGLFQQIIQDMKNGMPLWEDLIAKATKLHSTLKAAILAVTAYLEAFQKIADAATNARGATREIGTALTRICLRHKAVEARMKTFTSAIMDCLVLPLQERLEDWKKTVLTLDKEHAKEYKKARSELKKRSTDTLRLQKKMRKGAGGDLQKRLEYGLQDVNERRHFLEETEKQAVRAALLEERNRFCTFVGFLKPVMDEEIAMLSELSRVQEAVSNNSGWSFQTPPSSPSSLGSRKSSMCSISSLNSSSSGSSKSHHSPSHPHWHRSLSQPVSRTGPTRYTSVSSQDSGFTSQDTLYPRPPSSLSFAQVSNMSEHSNNSSNSSTPCTPFPATALPNTTATWPNLQETVQFERAANAIISDRPHTISSAYEKGHQRPPLTVYTFQAPEHSLSQPASPVTPVTETALPSTTTNNINALLPPRSPGPGGAKSASNTLQAAAKPPLPTRCSSLERPPGVIGGGGGTSKPVAGSVRVLPPNTDAHKLVKPTSLPPHITKAIPQPTYVNMHELASMAASKAQELNLPPPPADFITPIPTPTEKGPGEGEKDGSTSESSLESSSGYGSQTTFPVDDVNQQDDAVPCNLESASKYCTLPRNTSVEHFATSTIMVTSTVARRRPMSMSAVYSGAMRNTLLRRGSIQTNKPPPPIRRTSSITNTNRPLTPVGSLENLPPPPAFLLEPVPPAPLSNVGVNVAETVKALTELKHTPASPNALRRSVSQTQPVFPMPHAQQQMAAQQQSPILSSFQGGGKNKLSYVSQSAGGIIYAQPSQVIPGSPSAVRRISLRSQSAERKSTEGPGGVGSNFIAALSAKLAPSMSPRSSRRHSEDIVPAVNPMMNVQQQRGPGQSFLDSLNAKLAQQHIANNCSFLDSLNAKLAQQHIANNCSPQQIKVNKIRQIINSKTVSDPKICHESLMDQIKRGATLKRAKIINDRSASQNLPRISDGSNQTRRHPEEGENYQRPIGT
ncbi:IRSp53/MIM homology domain [Popillia japonica]|uniref:IRSp53/MIM homology domain n=1 Tax=Popillia japonica TaxID=7064 RepID=A0AAW1LI07_POPJA